MDYCVFLAFRGFGWCSKKKRNSAAPYIIGTGEDLLNLTQFFIVCENVVQPDTITSFRTSVVTLLAYHYVLNNQYPPQAQVICKFFEKVLS